MLFLSQDGIVGLEAVLGEERLAVGDLHVEQGVAQAKELVGWLRHGSEGVVEVREGERERVDFWLLGVDLIIIERSVGEPSPRHLLSCVD